MNQQHFSGMFNANPGNKNLPPPSPTDEVADDSDEEDSIEIAKTPKKKAGRRKIKIEYIDDKSRRQITFSKRKSGLMKKAYELTTLTGTQALLLVASETGHVYTFATPKLQPFVTLAEGKNLIQSCLNAPDTPAPTGQTNAPQNSGAPPPPSASPSQLPQHPQMPHSSLPMPHHMMNQPSTHQPAGHHPHSLHMPSSGFHPTMVMPNHAHHPFLQQDPYGTLAAKQEPQAWSMPHDPERNGY